MEDMKVASTAALQDHGMCETIPDTPDVDSMGLEIKLTVPKRAI